MPLGLWTDFLVSQMEMKQRRRVPVPDDGVHLSDGKQAPAVRSSKWNVLGSTKRIFGFCLLFRMINSLLIQTYFNPDEHWQSLEVAHRIVFGYGHLTWEWKRGIRSYLHPLVFAFLYKVISLSGLDTPFIMIRAPRLLQSVFSAVGDLYMYKLSNILFGENVAKWALFSQLVNWFVYFCFNRTFSNSLETVLTIVSLYYWRCVGDSPRKFSNNGRKWGLAIAALACAIRPTSAIIWIYVGMLELFLTRDRFRFVSLEVIPIGSMILGFSCLLDRVMYGSWVIVPLNFLKFNFLSSGGDYYGTHPWHWYFTQGFSVMLFTFTPFSIFGTVKSKNWKLSGLLLWVLVLYSVLGHKEFRFVLPVLPIALMFSGYALSEMEQSESSHGKRKTSLRSSTKWPRKLRLSVFFLLATNVPMALYMSMVHQRGTEDAMNYLSKEAYDGNVKSVLFLMPCHSTPCYSTLHKNIHMRFLDCTPSEEKGVMDESDRFMTDPAGFASEFARNWSMPSHIVLFASEAQKLGDFLLIHNFREINRFFHAHFRVDRDLQSSVVIYTWTT